MFEDLLQHEILPVEPWQAEVCLNQNKLKFKLDSGADVSVIPLSLYERLLLKKQSLKLEPTNETLLGPCNYKIKYSGKFIGNLSTDSRFWSDCFYYDIRCIILVSRTLF